MARPQPGKYYTVQNGDTFQIIALRAYGIAEKWTLIRDSNQLQFNSGIANQIIPGEQLYIPIDPALIEIRQQ